MNLLLLQAKQSITEVLYRYCRGLDRMDKALALSVWSPKAIVDYGATFRGKAAEFVDVAWKIHGELESHSHQISNILIEVDLDTNTASSESYVTAALRSKNDAGLSEQLTVRARYLDNWVLLENRWAIDKRLVIHDFSDIR